MSEFEPCPQCGEAVKQSKIAIEDHIRLSGEAWARGWAEKVRKARIRYSQEFQLAKARKPGTTDNHAHQIAIEQTQDELTVLETELLIAQRRLQ